MLAKALKGEELAQRLMYCLAVGYNFHNFDPRVVIVLDSFVRFWIGLFSLSYHAKVAWRERTGQSIRTFSETRRWIKWEVLKQALDLFADVEPFLRQNKQISPASRRHLFKIFDDPENLQKLRWELAVVIDAEVHFVNATYYLEGDGPLIFSCYECLSAHAVAVDHYPNTQAVAREIANGDAALFNRLITQAKACVRPGMNFYQQTFSVQFHDTVKAFKAARLCYPMRVQGLRATRVTNSGATAATLEEFRNFPFANNDATIASLPLARELPQYIAAVEGVTVRVRTVTGSAGGLLTEIHFHSGLQSSKSLC